MTGSRVGIALFVALSVCAVGWTVCGEQPILEFTISPDPVVIAVGDTSTVLISAANRSVYEADDVEFFWIENAWGITGESVEPLEVVDPFETGMVLLPVTIPNGAAPGLAPVDLEAVYTYCMDELCFQIAEVLSLDVMIVEAAVAVAEPDETQTGSVVVGPIASETLTEGSHLWPLVGGIGLGAVLAVTLVLAARKRLPQMVAVCSVGAVIAGGLGGGVWLAQHDQAQSIGEVLCTSCVGIEQAGDPIAEWSSVDAARIEAIDRPIELIVFSAPWCHSCPYAKAMVSEASRINDQITYRVIDVDKQPAKAKEYGVVRSGRTIVPAVVRLDTGKILFGIEAFESRFIDLLEGNE